jgi:HlyD family secretion protein
MKKKPLIYVAVLIVVIVGLYLIVYGFPGSKEVHYQFGTVTKGDIENTVSATGTLSPVTTVQVGTQVSGTIDSVYVDYNDKVKEGQILAVLDTTLLKATVVNAQANLQRAKAQLQQAQSDFNRNKTLYDRQLISDSDFETYKVNLATQEAAVKSAEASLEQAQRNLEYAVIRSPINGVVIQKNVESGQTVAASFSTPTLFIIAQSLSRMEILADVDESDIGQIHVGQPVTFQVAAFYNKEFTGTVKQIRLQPETIQNVVTYIVVVSAPNEDGVLLPGMTATLDFITQQLKDVLLVPNKALRFQPTQDQLNKYLARQKKLAESVKGADSASAANSPRPRPAGYPRGEQPTGFTGGNQASSHGTVWWVDSLGHLEAAHLRTGISDGTNTRVVASRMLHEGMEVIVGETSSSEQAQAEQRRPFRMRF